MNQYFSFSRFGRLARKHFTEHAAGYALSGTVLLGGLLAVMGFLSYVSGGLGHTGQAIIFTLGLLAGGSFFASSVLAGYGGQGSGAALALTLPASHLEKFLLAWLVSAPVFLLTYTGLFYLADWVVLTLGRYGEQPIDLLDKPEPLVFTLVLFALLHAVALWGSIFFRRQQFIRTGFLVFALVVALALVNYQAVRLLITPGIDSALPFSNVSLDGGPKLSLPESQTGWLGWLPAVLVALLWPAAYARLTEKQL